LVFILSCYIARVDLLELDSEMQEAMKGMDSFEDESSPNTRPCKFFLDVYTHRGFQRSEIVSFPPPRPKQSTPRPRSTHIPSHSHIRTHSSGDHSAGHSSRPPSGDSPVGTCEFGPLDWHQHKLILASQSHVQARLCLVLTVRNKILCRSLPLFDCSSSL
jgi:hypothetical protein